MVSEYEDTSKSIVKGYDKPLVCYFLFIWTIYFGFWPFFVLYILKFEIKIQKVSTLNGIPESAPEAKPCPISYGAYRQSRISGPSHSNIVWLLSHLFIICNILECVSLFQIQWVFGIIMICWIQVFSS